jgi:ribosomal protein S18 acetylase RimI-like enzyme
VTAPDASAVQVEEVAPTSGDAEYCLSQYFRELVERFDSGFDPVRSLAPTLDGFEPPSGSFLVMRLNGKPVGCGGFKRDAPDIAYLKRMWVAREVRGLGLGRRLLAELEDRARALDYRKLRLETEKSLTEAQRLYRSSGYLEVPRFNDELYADHWFEKLLA